MASLSATTSYACQGTQGIITLSNVSDAPGAPADGVYSWAVVDGIGTDFGGSIDPSQLPVLVSVPDATYAVRVRADYPDGSTGTSTPRTYPVNCSGNTGGGTSGGGGTTTPPPSVMGCTTPRALNYDPNATADSTPTSCEFVQAGALPYLAAAHLPIPFTVLASPTVNGQASIVRLTLETGPGFNGPWQLVGQLSQVCDNTSAARFNLSEAAKALLLTIPPPVETGIEGGLTALLKVGYEVVDPQTLQATAGGQAGIVRVVNAVVQPSEGKTMTSTSPYTEVPGGAALWRSVLTYAGGIVSTKLALPTGPCLARQFAWLNAAGGWDTGYFFGRHVHGTDQQDPVGYRDLAGTDRYASRGAVRPTLQVYSDKLDWATYQYLRGIRQSIQVYERLGPGQYVAVRVNPESFPEYQEQTDKTFNVDFTLSYPAQLIQTQ